MGKREMETEKGKKGSGLFLHLPVGISQVKRGRNAEVCDATEDDQKFCC
jgi:hypothetical protein